ncbi:hypothetical protein IMZ48_13365 [Candidatus Bathyarchaeota archaeon]|nr:hypothetical protein [Candidatus Bathyarchaeota archaeon]
MFSPPTVEEGSLTLFACAQQGNASTRPIIFIAHSLGGILVKNALALAYHGDGKHATTWVFTYGILFFGVPHGGTPDATWGKISGNIIRVYDSTQNTSFLSSIERDSAYNERLNESFKPLLEAYVFCSICETLPESEKVGVVSPQPLLSLKDRSLIPGY